MSGQQTRQEEGIISQAGNSGGATNEASQPNEILSALEHTGIVSSCLLIALIAFIALKLAKRASVKRNQKEASKANSSNEKSPRSYNVAEEILKQLPSPAARSTS